MVGDQLIFGHSYGQRSANEEVDALSIPHPHSTRLEDWILHCDLDNLEYQLTRSSSGDWISLSIPVCQLERMLGTKYHAYKHSTTEVTHSNDQLQSSEHPPRSQSRYYPLNLFRSPTAAVQDFVH